MQSFEKHWVNPFVILENKFELVELLGDKGAIIFKKRISLIDEVIVPLLIKQEIISDIALLVEVFLDYKGHVAE